MSARNRLPIPIAPQNYNQINEEQARASLDARLRALEDPDAAATRAALAILRPARNLIIGGDFTTNPWQRGTTFVAPATGAYCADRFFLAYTSSAVVTVSKTADAPTTIGAGIYTQHCYHVDVTTADTSIAVGDVWFISTRIEGLYVGFLGFGQTGARPVTLSFWVKSTKIGTFCVSLNNSAFDRSYVAEYAIHAANTWELKSITIPGDTSGTWLNTSGLGLRLIWTLASGSTFQTAAGVWAAGTYIASVNQVNALDNTANDFKIALVQIEEGTQATPFEAVPYHQVLHACQRYAVVADQYVPATTAQNLRTLHMRATPTITGGGAGFTSTGTTKDSLIAFQTAGAVQTLTLSSEL